MATLNGRCCCLSLSSQHVDPTKFKRYHLPMFATHLLPKSRKVRAWSKGRRLSGFFSASAHQGRNDGLVGGTESRLSIPYDILFLIAKLLSNDLSALRAFALVCTDWHAISRPFLLERIRVDDSLKTLGKLGELLDADSSISDFIRVVTVRSRETQFGTQSSTNEPWFYRLPTFLHQRLPRVSFLEMEGLAESPLSSTFFQRLSQNSSITSLSLVDCFTIDDVLGNFITSLPQLLDLHIHSNRNALNTHPSSFTSRPEHIPPLQSVIYHGHGLRSFLDWLGPVATLKSVGLHIDDSDTLPVVGSLLRLVNSTLERLELRILYKTWDERFCGFLSSPFFHSRG